MFGGLAFLIDGRMAVCATSQGGLMVRVDPERSAGLIDDGTVTRVVMRGRELDGWLLVRTATLDDAALDRWIAVGADYARTLPTRSAKSRT